MGFNFQTKKSMGILNLKLMVEKIFFTNKFNRLLIMQNYTNLK